MPITPSYTAVFDLDKDSATFGKFILTDTTDYASAGIALADVVGYWEITYPSGVVRQGSFASPDIDANVSLVFNTLSIPLDSNSDFLEGNYKFTYNVRVTGAVDPGDYASAESTYKFCPTVDFPSDDYATPTITYNVDCFCGKLTMTDSTSYGSPTTISRVLTIFPPPSLGFASVTGSSSSLTYDPTDFYTGGYELEVDTLVTYVSGIFTVKGRVKGSVYENIKCDINLCALYNCWDKYVRNVLTQSANFAGLKNIPSSLFEGIILGQQYADLFDNAVKCNQYTKAQYWYDKLVELVDCDCGCQAADDDTPTLVTPSCGGSSSGSTVVAAGNNISVTSSTVGTTTTYTVSVAQAFVDALSQAQTDISANTSAIAVNTAAIAAIQQARYTLLDSDQTGGSTTNTSFANLATYTLPANTLAVDGDYIKVSGRIATGLSTGSYQVSFRVTIGGQNLLVTLPYSSSNSLASKFETYIYRTSATTQRVISTVTFPNGSSSEVQVISTVNLATNLAINVDGQLSATASGAQDIEVTLFTVEQYKQA